MHIPALSIPSASIIQSFTQSNLPGKLIIFLLAIGSVWAWTIMVTKVRELQRAQRASKRFLTAFRGEPHPINLLLKRTRFPSSPLYVIYHNACRAVGIELSPGGTSPNELFIGGLGGLNGRMTEVKLDGVRNAAERNVADQALLLEKDMGFLATAVSTAPFLGLLGTVWGVMDAFNGMALTGAPTLKAVAPGISSALLTTVVGLLVALPSAIGYNLLTNKIRAMSVEMDNFAQEFVAEVAHTFFEEK